MTLDPTLNLNTIYLEGQENPDRLLSYLLQWSVLTVSLMHLRITWKKSLNEGLSRSDGSVDVSVGELSLLH